MDGRQFVQETQTRTVRGGVRGLHVRTDGGVGHLVHCSHGAVVDVAVDLRPASPTYRLWMTVVLDDIDHRSVWLPAGLAHGYQALTDDRGRLLPGQPDRAPRVRGDDPLRRPGPGHPLAVARDRGERRDAAAPALAVVEPMLDEWFGALQ